MKIENPQHLAENSVMRANCHAAETVASVRHTPEGWRDVIAKMVAAGAESTAGLDYKKIEARKERLACM